VKIPRDKLRCPGEKPKPPPKPAQGTTLASVLAAFVARLEHWGDGCAARLEEIDELQSRTIGAPAAPMKPVE